MENKIIQDLQTKVADYKRFGFILLSLSIFLFIGLIVPTSGVAAEFKGFIVAGVFIMLGLAFFFHRLAMKVQQKLYNEKN
ncbi:YrhC family protein [Bacillus solitudinis]|uniref:YrhC family protein n=1 Tax=Bacillus solitudinis TaxID=2014074 RepID=UPI000C246F3E|nr:YrhC family protein [Bacillus solitudinis]